jgi:hypothetical protein
MADPAVHAGDRGAWREILQAHARLRFIPRKHDKWHVFIDKWSIGMDKRLVILIKHITPDYRELDLIPTLEKENG